MFRLTINHFYVWCFGGTPWEADINPLCQLNTCTGQSTCLPGPSWKGWSPIQGWETQSLGCADELVHSRVSSFQAGNGIYFTLYLSFHLKLYHHLYLYFHLNLKIFLYFYFHLYLYFCDDTWQHRCCSTELHPFEFFSPPQQVQLFWQPEFFSSLSFQKERSVFPQQENFVPVNLGVPSSWW